MGSSLASPLLGLSKLGTLWKPLLSGERAKVSRLGLTERSTLRRGRAGTCGTSIEVAAAGRFDWREGRGGIVGAAMMGVKRLSDRQRKRLGGMRVNTMRLEVKYSERKC